MPARLHQKIQLTVNFRLDQSIGFSALPFGDHTSKTFVRKENVALGGNLGYSKATIL